MASIAIDTTIFHPIIKTKDRIICLRSGSAWLNQSLDYSTHGEIFICLENSLDRQFSQAFVNGLLLIWIHVLICAFFTGIFPRNTKLYMEMPLRKAPSLNSESGLYAGIIWTFGIDGIGCICRSYIIFPGYNSGSMHRRQLKIIGFN